MSAYADLQRVMNTAADLGAAAAVLGWDQETYMPDGSVSGRADQLATLSGLVHETVTGEKATAIAERVRAEYATYEERKRRVAAMFLRDFDNAKKLPGEHVEDMARTASMAQDAWKRARAASDFTIFQPLLEKIVDLKRREAELLGPAEHPYDNLLDQFEPGLTVASVTPVFDELRAGTVELIRSIAEVQGRVSDDVLYRSYPPVQQKQTATSIISALGFDLSLGRVDLSAHPFCTNFGNKDVRLTTRIREYDLRSCLFGLIHEAGHGMYEQGIADDLNRTSAGGGASMGIHESQSLFWENVIARSEEFWTWAFPILQKQFPDQLADQTVRSFYQAINVMRPSLNRVESDELTYNLHIILRFEIERELIAGSLSVKDIPDVWNEKMQTSLGVVPPNDAEGCLQDVHWSFGGIGYFPSYSLGKLYAAMEWNTMQQDIPDVRNKIASGDFAPILSWLREKIHTHGRTEFPHEIVQRVCGRPLTAKDFLDYVGGKARDVYGF
ncbi:MAG: carboxypeptidase M32 [Candidatus Kapabacteria bacterium]|nr:carboxypeptidase M32 [Candidatus Kapabacteria bacterium]